MTITATEFKQNLGKYLDMISTSGEDIYITKNGKVIAKMSNPKIDALNAIAGALKGYTYEPDENDLKMKRIMKKHG